MDGTEQRVREIVREELAAADARDMEAISEELKEWKPNFRALDEVAPQRDRNRSPRSGLLVAATLLLAAGVILRHSRIRSL